MYQEADLKGDKIVECLENSKWNFHIQQILTSSRYVVEKMLAHESVLIHCSDGWDRTSIVSSIVQLALDGYYRTIEGFLFLIYKEWIAFGHKFAERMGRKSSQL